MAIYLEPGGPACMPGGYSLHANFRERRKDELLRTPCLRTSENSPSETVWKFGIALSSGCHLWAKGCDKALFGRFQRSEEDDQNPFGHFPNSFSAYFGE